MTKHHESFDMSAAVATYLMTRRTGQAIPAEVSARGMNFGHSLLGT